MVKSFSIQGDTHNFGRNVKKVGDWVEKPRPIFWEWLFLNQESPLRSYFSLLSKEASCSNPFVGFPEAKSKFHEVGKLPYTGSVQFFSESRANLSGDSDAQILGNTLAVIMFFGMSDLHHENLCFAKNLDKKKSTKIFPLDIEIVFDSFEILSESYAVEALGVDKRDFGIQRLAEANLNVASIIANFSDAMQLLNNHSNEIQNILNLLPIEKVPIRRLLRDTSEYYMTLKGKGNIDLLDEEKEQLGRGDIPYFYSYLGSDSLFYLGVNGEAIVNLGNHEFSSAPPLPLKKACVLTVEDSFIKNSILQICRTFQPSYDQKIAYDESFINYDGKHIFVKVKELYMLKCLKLEK